MLITHVHASQVPNRTQTVRTQLQCRYIDGEAIFSGIQAFFGGRCSFFFCRLPRAAFSARVMFACLRWKQDWNWKSEGPSVGEITNPEVPLPFRPTLCLTLPSTPPHRLPRTHMFRVRLQSFACILAMHILLNRCRRRPRRAQDGAATLGSVPTAPPSTLRVTIAQGSDSPQPSD